MPAFRRLLPALFRKSGAEQEQSRAVPSGAEQSSAVRFFAERGAKEQSKSKAVPSGAEQSRAGHYMYGVNLKLNSKELSKSRAVPSIARAEQSGARTFCYFLISSILIGIITLERTN